MKIIEAAVVLPIAQPPIQNGGIVVDDSRIVAVGEIGKLKCDYPELEIESYPRHALLPALVNAHVHLELTGAPKRPFGSGSSFSEWLLCEGEYLNKVPPASLREAFATSLRELIDTGTGTAGVMGVLEGSTALLSQSGLSAVFFPQISSLSKTSAEDLYQNALALAEEGAEEKNGLLEVGLGPYAPYLLSRQVLKILSHYSRHLNLPMAIHAATTFSEMELFFDASGDLSSTLFPRIGWNELPPTHMKTPIQFLAGIECLTPRTILAAPVHLGPSDIELIRKFSVKLAHCPRANAYFNEGCAPIRACLDAKIDVGLGTESRASAENLSLWDEMRFAQNLHRNGKSPLTAEELLHMATLGGARVLGLSDRVGSLEPGKRADTIAVKIEDGQPSSIYDELLERTTGKEVETLVVNGQKLKG